MRIPQLARATLGALALAAAAAGAQAYTIGTVSANGNVVDTSFATDAMLSLAIDAKNFQPVTFTIGVQAGDPEVLPFNALWRNLVGLGVPQLEIVLQGATFATLGGAAGTFGTQAFVSGGPGQATIRLLPAENVEVAIGDWFLDGARTDFGINLADALPSFTLSVSAVPEPDMLALWAAGFAVTGLVAYRRTGARGR